MNSHQSKQTEQWITSIAHDILYRIVIALQVHYPPLYVSLWAPTIVWFIDRHSKILLEILNCYENLI